MEWKLEKYSRCRVKPEKATLLANIMYTLSKNFAYGFKRQYSFSAGTGKNAACSSEALYGCLKSRTVRWFPGEVPGRSSPTALRRRHSRAIEYDAVCQRLPLDSPPHEEDHSLLHLHDQKPFSPRDSEGMAGRKYGDKTNSAANGKPEKFPQSYISGINIKEEEYVWKEHEAFESESWRNRTPSQLQPFSILQTGPSMSCSRFELELCLAIPGMLDDYYLNLLAWSEQNLVALGLGSSVYVWNAEAQALQGSLHIRPPASLVSFISSSYSFPSISSVAWSKDGHSLAIGKHDGEIQLWDVEHGRNLQNVTGHLSLVGSLSFNQHVLSSGSLLGFIHHHDFRAARPMVGSIQQQKGVCGLQWCPDGGKLASGTTDGLLSIWPNDPGNTQKCLPLLTVQHRTAVKALHWSPQQLELVAVGGGREDRTLRIWNTNTGVCQQSAQSNSQICSLCWCPESQEIFTGHSVPHHQITCWKVQSLTQLARIHGHKGRVLHIALSPCGTRLFTVGSDHQACVWKLLDQSSQPLEEAE